MDVDTTATTCPYNPGSLNATLSACCPERYEENSRKFYTQFFCLFLFSRSKSAGYDWGCCAPRPVTRTKYVYTVTKPNSTDFGVDCLLSGCSAQVFVFSYFFSQSFSERFLLFIFNKVTMKNFADALTASKDPDSPCNDPLEKVCWKFRYKSYFVDFRRSTICVWSVHHVLRQSTSLFSTSSSPFSLLLLIFC